MSGEEKPLRIYIVLGENSGDALGAQLLKEFRDKNIELEVGGLAGPKMIEMGAESLFDITETSVMGFSDVLPRLPNLLRRISQVKSDALKFDPDILLLIDSPEFTQAIARKFRKKNTKAKIVKYVCPSVWFWRPGRAKKMVAYIDHILALLPFEPAALKELEGPQTSYVGHPLSNNLERFSHGDRLKPQIPPNILLLPGSRAGEIKRILPLIGEVVAELDQLGMNAKYTIPAVDHLEDTIRSETANWPQNIEIITGLSEKDIAFQQADAAVACSGTVMLELALFEIPAVSIYKMDMIFKMLRWLTIGWTANLANLIADKVVIPELINEYAKPKRIARILQELAQEGPARQAQLEGYKLILSNMTGKSMVKQSPVDIIVSLAKAE